MASKKDVMEFSSRHYRYEFQIPFELEGEKRHEFIMDRFHEFDYFETMVRKNLKAKGDRIEEEGLEHTDGKYK